MLQGIPSLCHLGISTLLPSAVMKALVARSLLPNLRHIDGFVDSKALDTFLTMIAERRPAVLNLTA